MAGISISGAVSKIDTGSIVDGLVSLQANQQTLLKNKQSAAQMTLGSAGVPESFIVDGQGVIRYQHIGEIRANQLPLILQKLREAAQ